MKKVVVRSTVGVDISPPVDTNNHGGKPRALMEGGIGSSAELH